MPQLNGPGRDWHLDPATGPQLALIRRKQLASDEECLTMTKGYASALIRAHAPTHLDRDGEASPAQVKLVKSLCEALDEAPGPHLANLSRATASIIIDQLQKRVATEAKLPEGFYMLDGQFYRVKLSSNGRPYANRLVKLLEPEQASNGWRTHRFVHTPFVVGRIRLRHALTREQAIKFGQETSSCIRCGVQLKPEIKTKSGESRWIGPDCEKKMGWA